MALTLAAPVATVLGIERPRRCVGRIVRLRVKFKTILTIFYIYSVAMPKCRVCVVYAT